MYVAMTCHFISITRSAVCQVYTWSSSCVGPGSCLQPCNGKTIAFIQQFYNMFYNHDTKLILKT